MAPTATGRRTSRPRSALRRRCFLVLKFSHQEEEAPLIIHRLHNLQHNGLRVPNESRKTVSFKARRHSNHHHRQNSREVEEVVVARCKIAPPMPATPPPIRSYQQDMLKYLMDKNANKTASIEEDNGPKPEIHRLNRNDKKAGGWALPDPTQKRGKLVKALHLFLVNLSRPTDQRNQVELTTFNYYNMCHPNQKRGGGNAILNTSRKPASTMFSAFNGPIGFSLL